MELPDLLKIAVERKASDLHIKVGSPPVLRIDDKLVPLMEMPRLGQDAVVTMAAGIMNAKQREKFKERCEIDLAYSVPGLGRFRANVFQQRGTVGVVLRVIPIKIQTIGELNLPPVLEKISMEPRGLILVTGTTGSGKSSTLAAMIDYINAARSGHIITIEDPIEFLHRDKMSLVNQREVGMDTPSFSEALRSALRQDPDIILVGEMRDYETISTGILAAETDVLLLNDDARLMTKFGFTSMSFAARSRPDVGICSAAISGVVGNLNQQPWLVAAGMRYEPHNLAFVAIYIPKNTFDRVGPLDEQFVGYGYEDNDYCLRVQKAGLGLSIYDGCVVEHSDAGKSSFRTKPDISALMDANRELFRRKWPGVGV